MQSAQQGTTTARRKGTWNGVERRRVEKVVETLATLGSRGESLAEVAHDARNMVTALALYCDLLDEPGVLASAFKHYAQELRLVAAASRRLVEKLVALDTNPLRAGTIASLLESGALPRTAQAGTGEASQALPASAAELGAAAVPGSSMAAPPASRSFARAAGGLGELSTPEEIAHTASFEEQNRRWDLLPALPVTNLAAELIANRNLLAALAGPAIALTIETDGGAQPVRLTGEDLTRLLVNLVKNAAEAMPQATAPTMTLGRRIHIGLREVETLRGAAPCLALTVEDNGPGIPEEALEKVFVSGYTTRAKAAAAGAWPQAHRGLGLAIVRSIVEGAGGRITAANRSQGGACFTLELPVRNATPQRTANH
jgi:signal transduction histidine kinase